MSQNTSSAVMQQRSEAHDSLDDFPTPPWATRALIRHVIEPALDRSTRSRLLSASSVWEPCANRGFMALPLREFFDCVLPSDIHDYGVGYPQHDFLMPYLPFGDFDWIIANPPFRLGAQFIHRALDIARQGVAMLVRTSFLEGEERYTEIYSVRPPTIVAQFVERVVMHKGVLRNPNVKYWSPTAINPQTRKKTGAWIFPTSATSYCWLVWITGMAPLPTVWIPPCRRMLEREGDYPNGK